MREKEKEREKKRERERERGSEERVKVIKPQSIFLQVFPQKTKL
jgi:hypothetical protein